MSRLRTARTVAALLAGTSSLIGFEAMAVAQTASPVPSTATTDGAAETAAAPTEASLAEIVVTAQRRSENLQRAAIAVAVISPATLVNAGVFTSSTLNAAVPALVVTKAGGATTSYFVRGVGNFTVNAYADPAIAFNYDGVYLGRPTSTTGTFFDLDRIEVLKGPQGTLYGRNATGGAVNVIPTRPKLGQLSGYAVGGYGNYDAVDLEAAINLPIGNNAAIRIAGKLIDQDGYNKDGTFDEVGQGVRAQILFEPSDALSIRLAGDYSHQGGVGVGASFDGTLQFSPGAPAVPGQIANYRFTPIPAGLGRYDGLHSPQAKAYFATRTISGAFINPAPNLYPSLDNDYYGVNAEISLKTGVGTFTFIPAYRDAKLRQVFNGPAFYAGLAPERDQQFSAELRLDGESFGAIDWLIGAFYYDEDIKARYTFSQYQINAFQDLTTGTESQAVFGRVVANLSDRLRLVGAARYTHDEKRFDVVADTLVQICANAPPPRGPGCFGGPSVPPSASLADLPFRPIPSPNGPPVPFGTFGNLLVVSRLVLDTTRSFNRLTYKGGIEFDIAPRSLLYVNYETGFRSGGFSASSSRPFYDPEYIKALTLGVKNRFLDNRLQLNVELFRWQYRNQQVTHFGVENNGATNLFTENLGRSTIQGVDLDTEVLATRTTLLRGSVQYLDNKIKSFTYTAPFGGVSLPPVTGCVVRPPAAVPAAQVFSVDCAGQRGYNSPRWSVNGGIDQTVEVGDYKLVFTGDVRYRSNRIIGFERLPQQNSGSDTTLDASVHFSPNSDRWGLTAYVRNITNVAANVATQYSGSTGNTLTTNYSPPRTYGLRANVKF